MSMLSDPVFHENLEDQLDVSQDSVSIMTDWVARLLYQRAPGPLVERVTKLRDTMVEVREELRTLQPCFPKERR